ncbi:MAG: DUF4157 domain-containing protein [Burkholderiales bacterium]|nr:DUF4157 domain-containing protein [Burkholderiales bacterium]
MHTQARKNTLVTVVRPVARGPVRGLPQSRLRLGGVHDEAERQADRIASQVLGRGGCPPAALTGGWAAAARRTSSPIQAGSGGRSQDQGQEEQRVLPAALERRLLALASTGEPLPEAVRRDMEPRFGMDLGRVRIHTDAEAAALSEALRAHAFTLGEHIGFNRGRFRPEHPAGRFLLAHELAHVAQHHAASGGMLTVRRGFWSDLYASVVDTLGDVADWAIDKVREYGWRLLERISPEFARIVQEIIDEGMLTWLGRRVAQAWDAYLARLRALVPFDAPRRLIELFAGLIERAARIAAALASGDCAPLMAAITALKTFVSETVGAAWERLTEFLAPIGDFFRGLWDDFATPALAWLQRFGGEVWEGIQALGRRLWEWIRPVREAASRIWVWFRETLFGPEAGTGDSAESAGGVLAWITRKAGEAWDWVKERTRPVWQPVVDLATRVAELLPPAFVRELGESARQLSGQLDAISEGMAGGEGLPAAREPLANVLPSVQDVLATLRRILAGAGAWLSQRMTEVVRAVTGLIGRLRANALLSWLSGALEWLAEGVDALLTWARDQVAGLFDRLLQGFDALTPFMQTVLETVRRLIVVATDLVQLPLLVLGSLWQRIPACIREPIERFLQEQILARIPVFGQFFTDPELWPRLRDTAFGILRRIFVDGDLLGATWAFFQALLRLLGLPPELVVQILAKAAQALADILGDPIGFIGNLLRALGAGFMGFFERIGTHLLNGFTHWLFGTVREAGIQPPTDLSLRSVFSFVLEVLGVTVDTVFDRLARRLEPTVVQRLRGMLSLASGVWSFVATLVDEGPAGLWRELSERLSDLWDTVVDGVIGFITERVIGWASRWLASLLDVTGIMPVINTLTALYRAVESFLEYLRELLEIVSRVLDGVTGIARGTIGEAAAYLEDALAHALPVAIGFLANQAGLGRLSQRLREILGGLRARIEDAIDWLIDRAVRLGGTLIDLARRGVTAVRQWWRQRFAFRGADGEQHSLYLQNEQPDGELMVSSTPRNYRAFLDALSVSAAQRATKAQAQALYEEFRRMQRQAAQRRRSAVADEDGSAGDEHSAALVDRIQRLAELTALLMAEGGDRSSVPRFSTVTAQGYGQGVRIDRLTARREHWPFRGSRPSARSPRWDRLSQRRTEGNPSDYMFVRGHLLNDHLDGPGDLWENLAPLTQDANNRRRDSMLHRFEQPVKETVQSQGQVLAFEVQAHYPAGDRSADLRAIDTELAKLERGERAVRPLTQLRTIREIVVEEQYIPATLDCSAELLPARGQRQSIRAIIHNADVMPKDWRRYTLAHG